MPARPRIALVTCAPLPEGDPDDRLLLPSLDARGLAGEFAVWDDAAVEWDAFDLVVVRSTWDYPTRRDAFLAWADGVPRLANPAAVVRENTDKRYLDRLAAAGVPVVPTRFVEGPDDVVAALHGDATVVVKPVVGAGSKDTGRYDLAAPTERAAAVGLAERILAGGRAVIVQPYLAGVDIEGETALVHVDGVLSHAVRKAALLAGPAGDVAGLYVEERVAACAPTPAQRALAARALATVTADGPPLYARVDVLPGPGGAPVVLEVELTEPSLFLGHAPGAADRLAGAIADRVRPRVV